MLCVRPPVFKDDDIRLTSQGVVLLLGVNSVKPTGHTGHGEIDVAFAVFLVDEQGVPLLSRGGQDIFAQREAVHEWCHVFVVCSCLLTHRHDQQPNTTEALR